MDDYNTTEYKSHSGNTAITSLRMISGGKTITLNFLSVDRHEVKKYKYEPKEIMNKHPAMREIEKEHHGALSKPPLSQKEL